MDKELLYRFYKDGRKFLYIAESLTKFKAGGVSDTNVKAVFAESSRMSLLYGEPWLKVKVIEYKKLTKDRISRILKKTPFYMMLKKK